MDNKNENSAMLALPLGKLMRMYSIPCIVSLLVGALYNIVDQIFIANADYLGSYGNAANSVVFPLTVIALALATMLGDGACAFVSLSLGAGRRDDAHRAVGSTVVVTLLVSAVVTAIYIVFAGGILTGFGATVNETTFDMSREYFFWISVGIPAYMFGQAMNPIIRSDGSPKFAMATLIAGSVANIILDYVFIYPMHMGMAGAAIATIIGQFIAAVMAAGYLFKMKTVKLSKDSFKVRWKLFGKIIPLGMTSFLSQISMVFSMAAVNNMARKYGALDPIFGQEEYAQIPTAVIGIVMKFFQIVISLAIGLSAGCIPVAGFNMGAGRGDRAKELFKKLLLAEALVGLAATIVFECFPNALIQIFGAGNESVYYTEFAIKAIRLFLCMAILSCVNKGTFIYLQALGKPWISTGLSMLREIVLGVGLVLLLPAIFGLNGLLYFMALADIITFIVAMFVIRATMKELSTVKCSPQQPS